MIDFSIINKERMYLHIDFVENDLLLHSSKNWNGDKKKEKHSIIFENVQGF